MSDTVHDFLKQGRGLIDESNADLCAALHYDGYISIVKAFDGDEMFWGWELTEDGKHMASLPTLPDPPTAPEPPACPNCDAGRVMADGDGWRCPFCGWRSEPEPSAYEIGEILIDGDGVGCQYRATYTDGRILTVRPDGTAHTWPPEAIRRGHSAAPEPCIYCRGAGSIEREFYGGQGGFKTMTCPACGGTGKHADEIERRARMARNEPVFAAPADIEQHPTAPEPRSEHAAYGMTEAGKLVHDLDIRARAAEDMAYDAQRRAEAAEARAQEAERKLAAEREAHAALREADAENARLRKVAEAAQACVDSRVFTGREDPHHYRVPNEKLNAVMSALAILHNPELDADYD